MNRGNMGKQLSNAPKSKPKKVKKMAFGGMASMPMPGAAPPSAMTQAQRMATAMSPPPGVAQAAAQFARDQSQMSPAAMSSIGQQAMLRGQQMNTSGPQLGRPGSAVRPMPVKPMPGGVRGMSGPKPALMGMAKGGKVGRGDGCCMKGKTKGKMC